MKITREELIKKYIDFFKKKNHKEIQNSGLIPLNDPTVLFTTAGMHPLVPFLLGQKHPLGKRLVNNQKCIRTGDIDEVGDDVHLTFFEMLGNWSLGDYFKKEAIEMSFEFLTKVLKLPVDKLAVSCFKGDKDASKDSEAAKYWESVGIPKNRIVFFSKKDNWWGPAGKTGPCGPDTEMFYWVGKGKPKPLTTGDNAADWVEIWNDVFMQYVKDDKGKYNTAKQQNVDTGMGVERTLAVLLGKTNVFEIPDLAQIIKEIETISEKKYDKKTQKSMRIICDHVRASVFIIGDGVKPSNVERGYVLRRLIRRAIRYGRVIGIKKNFTHTLAKVVVDIYSKSYPELKENRQKIIELLNQEEDKFISTLEKGMNVFKKIASGSKVISGKDAFLLYQSYGFPIEMTVEMAKENKTKVDVKGFETENKKHQELSRKSTIGVFKSGLADSSETITKLHTATHLMNEALRQVLNQEIKQRGSNITAERTRFDFNFPRKLTDEEKKKIEEWVNDKIKRKLKVIREEMPLKKAFSSGAHGEFGAKYPPVVSVFTVVDEKGKAISKEICTGPHVKNTGEIGTFKIKKEQSSSLGVRRIKAVLV